jgi:hypothetical protein
MSGMLIESTRRRNAKKKKAREAQLAAAEVGIEKEINEEILNDPDLDHQPVLDAQEVTESEQTVDHKEDKSQGRKPQGNKKHQR